MAKQIKWGVFSWSRGWESARIKSLRELAAKGGQDLEHAINFLLRIGTEETEMLAEELFDQYA